MKIVKQMFGYTHPNIKTFLIEPSRINININRPVSMFIFSQIVKYLGTQNAYLLKQLLN